MTQGGKYEGVGDRPIIKFSDNPEIEKLGEIPKKILVEPARGFFTRLSGIIEKEINNDPVGYIYKPLSLSSHAPIPPDAIPALTHIFKSLKETKEFFALMEELKKRNPRIKKFGIGIAQNDETGEVTFSVMILHTTNIKDEESMREWRDMAKEIGL